MPQTDVLVNIDAKADKAIRETKKLQNQLKKLKDGPSAASKGFGKMRQEATGLSGQIAGIVGQMSILGGAAKLMVDAWARSRQDAERIANIIKGRESGEKYLRQLSTSESDYQRNLQAAKYFGAAYGITDQNESLATRGAMLAGGFTSREDVAALGAYQQLGSAREIAPSLATVRGAFGGSAEQNINMLITASGPSKFSSQQLAQGVAVAGEDLAASGVSAPEFFSALTSNEAGKSVESISERLKALSNARLRIMGQGGDGGANLAEFAARFDGMSDAEALKILGSTEALQGLRYWNNRNRQKTESIKASGQAAGGPESILRRRAGFGQGPEEEVRRLRATLDVMSEGLGQEELEREAGNLAYKIQARAKHGEAGGVVMGASDMYGDFMTFLHGITGTTDRLGDNYRRTADEMVGELAKASSSGSLESSTVEGLGGYMMRNFIALSHPDPTRSQTLKQGSGDSFGGNR